MVRRVAVKWVLGLGFGRCAARVIEEVRLSVRVRGQVGGHLGLEKGNNLGF